jgi:hypothetical protein
MPYEAKSSAADRAAFNGAFTRMLGLAHFSLLRLKWIVVGSRLVFAIGFRVQVSDLSKHLAVLLRLRPVPGSSTCRRLQWTNPIGSERMRMGLPPQSYAGRGAILKRVGKIIRRFRRLCARTYVWAEVADARASCRQPFRAQRLRDPDPYDLMVAPPGTAAALDGNRMAGLPPQNALILLPGNPECSTNAA